MRWPFLPGSMTDVYKRQPHIDHHEGRLIFLDAGYCCYHQVTADGGGIVHDDVEPGLDAGTHLETGFSDDLFHGQFYRV